jgi:hypothetical protein
MGVSWLDEATAIIRAAAPEERLGIVAGYSPGVSRRLGGAALGEAGPVIRTACGPLKIAAWSAGDAGRACLLLAAGLDDASEAADEQQARQVAELFRAGDEGERVSLVRALCLLSTPCAAVATARQAGRINSLRLYAGLALDNPFPAACYGERDFNQVVLKCLFNGLPIGRIDSLDQKANPELSRMCQDYFDERVAAGRAVPSDIYLALVPHADERGLGLAMAALGHADAAHRIHAARALTARRDAPGVHDALARRLAVETDPAVTAILTSRGVA